MCFGCSSVRYKNSLQQHLMEQTRKTPLEKMAEALLTYEETDETARMIFGAYDKFLEMLDQEQVFAMNLTTSPRRARLAILDSA